MRMYLISKEFGFEYGHRVWNQELSNGGLCKCRHLHGHSGSLTVEIGSEKLHRDMVLDYNELSFVKEFVDLYLDHRMILDYSDPIIPQMLGVSESELVLDEMQWGFCKIKCYGGDAVRKELFDSIVLIDCVPTSENFCRIIYEGLAETGVPVSRVRFKETLKTEASYAR